MHNVANELVGIIKRFIVKFVREISVGRCVTPSFQLKSLVLGLIIRNLIFLHMDSTLLIINTKLEEYLVANSLIVNTRNN